MVALSDLTLLAKTAAGRLKGVAGSTITVALATLAQGLRKADDIDIDADKAIASNVFFKNTTFGTVAINVAGSIAARDSIQSATALALKAGANVLSLVSTPSAARVVTIPDATGNVALNSVNNAFTTTQSVTGAVNASSTVSVQNNGSTQSITLSGSPTGNRVVTFPDADITIGPSIYIGSDTKANLNALPASATPLTAFCTDIAGMSGGVTGVQVYWSPATVAWLRYSNDSPI